MLQSDCPKSGIKPLCLTHWTVRTTAIDAVIKQYTVIIETLEEMLQTARDECGLKAAGIVSSLEKFETLFNLKLGHHLFSVAEETSSILQTKDISFQEAISAVNVASVFYQHQRNEEVMQAQEFHIGQPQLPRYRKRPTRFDSVTLPHQFSNSKDLFRSVYFEACDLLIKDLKNALIRKM